MNIIRQKIVSNVIRFLLFSLTLKKMLEKCEYILNNSIKHHILASVVRTIRSQSKSSDQKQIDGSSFTDRLQLRMYLNLKE